MAAVRTDELQHMDLRVGMLIGRTSGTMFRPVPALRDTLTELVRAARQVRSGRISEWETDRDALDRLALALDSLDTLEL